VEELAITSGLDTAGHEPGKSPKKKKK
jgi:hypothetical protein